MLFSHLPCLRTSPRTSLHIYIYIYIYIYTHTHTHTHTYIHMRATVHCAIQFSGWRERDGGREGRAGFIHALRHAMCQHLEAQCFLDPQPLGERRRLHTYPDPQIHPCTASSNVPYEVREMEGRIEERAEYPSRKRARGACAQEAGTGQHKMLTREARVRSRASTRRGGAR